MERRAFIGGVLAVLSSPQLNGQENDCITAHCEKGIDILIVDPNRPFIVEVGTKVRPAGVKDLWDMKKTIPLTKQNKLSFKVEFGNTPYVFTKKSTSVQIRRSDIKNKLIIIRVGSEENPATLEDLDKVAKETSVQHINPNKKETDFILITHHCMNVKQS